MSVQITIQINGISNLDDFKIIGGILKGTNTFSRAKILNFVDINESTILFNIVKIDDNDNDYGSKEYNFDFDYDFILTERVILEENANAIGFVEKINVFDSIIVSNLSSKESLDYNKNPFKYNKKFTDYLNSSSVLITDEFNVSNFTITSNPSVDVITIKDYYTVNNTDYDSFVTSDYDFRDAVIEPSSTYTIGDISNINFSYNPKSEINFTNRDLILEIKDLFYSEKDSSGNDQNDDTEPLVNTGRDLTFLDQTITDYNLVLDTVKIYSRSITPSTVNNIVSGDTILYYGDSSSTTSSGNLTSTNCNIKDVVFLDDSRNGYIEVYLNEIKTYNFTYSQSGTTTKYYNNEEEITSTSRLTFKKGFTYIFDYSSLKNTNNVYLYKEVSGQDDALLTDVFFHDYDNKKIYFAIDISEDSYDSENIKINIYEGTNTTPVETIPINVSDNTNLSTIHGIDYLDQLYIPNPDTTSSELYLSLAQVTPSPYNFTDEQAQDYNINPRRFEYSGKFYINDTNKFVYLIDKNTNYSFVVSDTNNNKYDFFVGDIINNEVEFYHDVWTVTDDTTYTSITTNKNIKFIDIITSDINKNYYYDKNVIFYSSNNTLVISNPKTKKTDSIYKYIFGSYWTETGNNKLQNVLIDIGDTVYFNELYPGKITNISIDDSYVKIKVSGKLNQNDYNKFRIFKKTDRNHDDMSYINTNFNISFNISDIPIPDDPNLSLRTTSDMITYSAENIVYESYKNIFSSLQDEKKYSTNLIFEFEKSRINHNRKYDIILPFEFKYNQDDFLSLTSGSIKDITFSQNLKLFKYLDNTTLNKTFIEINDNRVVYSNDLLINYNSINLSLNKKYINIDIMKIGGSSNKIYTSINPDKEYSSLRYFENNVSPKINENYTLTFNAKVNYTNTNNLTHLENLTSNEILETNTNNVNIGNLTLDVEPIINKTYYDIETGIDINQNIIVYTFKDTLDANTLQFGMILDEHQVFFPKSFITTGTNATNIRQVSKDLDITSNTITSYTQFSSEILDNNIWNDFNGRYGTSPKVINSYFDTSNPTSTGFIDYKSINSFDSRDYINGSATEYVYVSISDPEEFENIKSSIDSGSTLWAGQQHQKFGSFDPNSSMVNYSDTYYLPSTSLSENKWKDTYSTDDQYNEVFPISASNVDGNKFETTLGFFGEVISYHEDISGVNFIKIDPKIHQNHVENQYICETLKMNPLIELNSLTSTTYTSSNKRISFDGNSTGNLSSYYTYLNDKIQNDNTKNGKIYFRVKKQGESSFTKYYTISDININNAVRSKVSYITSVESIDELDDGDNITDIEFIWESFLFWEYIDVDDNTPDDYKNHLFEFDKRIIITDNKYDILSLSDKQYSNFTLELNNSNIINYTEPDDFTGDITENVVYNYSTITFNYNGTSYEFEISNIDTINKTITVSSTIELTVSGLITNITFNTKVLSEKENYRSVLNKMVNFDDVYLDKSASYGHIRTSALEIEYNGNYYPISMKDPQSIRITSVNKPIKYFISDYNVDITDLFDFSIIRNDTKKIDYKITNPLNINFTDDLIFPIKILTNEYKVGDIVEVIGNIYNNETHFRGIVKKVIKRNIPSDAIFDNYQILNNQTYEVVVSRPVDIRDVDYATSPLSNDSYIPQVNSLNDNFNEFCVPIVQNENNSTLIVRNPVTNDILVEGIYYHNDLKLQKNGSLLLNNIPMNYFDINDLFKSNEYSFIVYKNSSLYQFDIRDMSGLFDLGTKLYTYRSPIVINNANKNYIISRNEVFGSSTSYIKTIGKDVQYNQFGYTFDKFQASDYNELISSNISNYIDFDLGLSIDSNGNLVTYSQENSVRNSLRNLIKTNLNERVYQPSFGSTIRNYLFEQMDRFTLLELERDLRNTIIINEPRVSLNSINIVPDEYQNFIKINIYFGIKGFQNKLVEEITVARNTA